MNKDKNIDIINRGWGEMSNLLDKAMPIGSTNSLFGRKRVAFLLLLFLFISIGGFFYIFNYSKLKKEHNEVIQKESIVNSSINSFAAIDNANSNGNANNNDNVNSNDDRNNQSFIQSEDKIVEPKNETKQVRTINRPNNSDLVSRTSQRSSIKQNLVTVNKSIFKQGELAGNLKSNNITSLVDFHKREDIQITRLEALIIPKLENTYVLSYSDKIKPVLLFKNMRKCFGKALSFDLRGISEDFRSFGGIEGGFQYQIKMSNNIGVGIGVDFSYFRKQGMNNAFFTNVLNHPDYDGSNELDKIRPLGVNTRYKEEFNLTTRNPYTMSGFINELYYIGIPIGVFYNKNKFEIAFGLKIAYMLKGTNFTANKNLIGGQNYVIYSPAAFYNSNVYSRFDYSTYLAFDYSISRNIAITSKFNYSFSRIINSPKDQIQNNYRTAIIDVIEDRYNNRFDSNTFFSLGLKYKFKNRCFN